jgi:hypothetical protein
VVGEPWRSKVSAAATRPPLAVAWAPALPDF